MHVTVVRTPDIGKVSFVLVAISVMVFTLLITRPAARLLAHRFDCSWFAAAGLVVVTGVVLAVDLWCDARPAAPFLVVDRHFFVSQLTSPGQWWDAVTTIGGTGRELASIALLVPAGFFSHLVFRKPAISLPAGVLIVAAGETVKNLAGQASDLNDLVNGAAGFLAGALLAATAIMVRRRGPHKEAVKRGATCRVTNQVS